MGTLVSTTIRRAMVYQGVIEDSTRVEFTRWAYGRYATVVKLVA